MLLITRSKYLQVSVQKNIKTAFFCKVIIELLRDSDKLCSTSAGTIVKKQPHWTLVSWGSNEGQNYKKNTLKSPEIKGFIFST